MPAGIGYGMRPMVGFAPQMGRRAQPRGLFGMGGPAGAGAPVGQRAPNVSMGRPAVPNVAFSPSAGGVVGLPQGGGAMMRGGDEARRQAYLNDHQYQYRHDQGGGAMMRGAAGALTKPLISGGGYVPPPWAGGPTGAGMSGGFVPPGPSQQQMPTNLNQAQFQGPGVVGPNGERGRY